MNHINDENVELYSSLFRGRTDTFVRYWEKDGRSGYSPAYSFNWNEFLMHKQKGGSMKTFENKKMIPLTKEVIKQLAFPFSLEGKLVQYIGRLLHSAHPKFVFDYRDSKVAFLERQYKQRQRYYKKLRS